MASSLSDHGIPPPTTPLPGPAPGDQELPPTLQPGAIFQAAPPRKRALSVLISLTIYGVLVGSATAWFTRRQAAHRKVPFPTLTLTLQDLLEPGPQPPMATMVGQEPAAATISLDPERVVLDPILPVEALPREQPDLSAPLIPPTPPPVDAHLPAASRGAGSGATPGLAAGHGFTQGSGRTRFRGVPGMTPDLDLKDLEVIHEEIPTYPWMAELAHVQGDVVVRVTLNEQGVPIHTELIEGPPALQAETMRAVKHWRFGKGIFRGKKVEATFDMVFRYILR